MKTPAVDARRADADDATEKLGPANRRFNAREAATRVQEQDWRDRKNSPRIVAHEGGAHDLISAEPALAGNDATTYTRRTERFDNNAIKLRRGSAQGQMTIA